MKKKALALLLALSMTAAMAGCGGSGGDSGESKGGAADSGESKTEQSADAGSGDGEDAVVESQKERSGNLTGLGAQQHCRPRETGARTKVEEGARLVD